MKKTDDGSVLNWAAGKREKICGKNGLNRTVSFTSPRILGNVGLSNILDGEL